jgi:hypothetical protein
MNAYELADQVEMWGGDLLALNMKGGIPVIEGAKMLRHQADYIAQLEKGLESSIAMNKAQAERFAELEAKHKQEFDYAEKLLKERNE